MYDIRYYDRMLRNYSGTAEHICRKRWEFVSSIGAKTVLDYGAGVGWFRAFAPKGVAVDTYDIMPTIQTGITRTEYDLVTFWDSLEHLKSPDEIVPVLMLAGAVALTIPILPECRDLRTWKHWKPGEHFLYPTVEQVRSLFKYYDFDMLEADPTIECPPREDVWSFLFRRDDAKKIDTCERPEPWGHSPTDYSDPGLAQKLSG